MAVAPAFGPAPPFGPFPLFGPVSRPRPQVVTRSLGPFPPFGPVSRPRPQVVTRSLGPFPPFGPVSRPRPAGLLAIFFVLAIALFAATGARAAGVVVVVADRLDRTDLWDAPGPNLARLRREASAGLVSTRFLLSALPESAYAALGAGSFVQYEGSLCWRGGGTAEDGAAYRVATGRSLPAGALACREIERLFQFSNPDVRPGALGTLLHAAGKRTACIGNADVPGRPRRQVLAIAMDERGMVDAGDVDGGAVALDPAAPGGRRLDVTGSLRLFARVAPRCDLVVTESGDTSRLAVLKGDLAPEAYEAARVAALARLDALVGGLRARIDPARTLFILVAPAPPVVPSATEQVLTPIFVAGAGWPAGLLLSATTRRAGVVANADVAATIAAHLGAGPLPGAMGRPLRARPASEAGARLRGIDEAARRVSHWRFPAIGFWVAAYVAAILLAGLALLLRSAQWPLWVARARARLHEPAMASRIRLGGSLALPGGDESRPGPARAARAGVLFAMALPVGAYLVAGIAPSSLPAYLAWLSAASLAAAAGAAGISRLRAGVPAPAVLFAVLAAALLGDAALGAPRQWRMMVSYTPTDAARYYGIGNETMGVLIGMALATLACFPAGRRTAAAAAVLAVLLGMALGDSAVGANFGGALSASFALALASVLAAGRRIRGGALIPLVSAILVGLALAGLDSLRPGDAMSHVGRGVASIRGDGLAWAAAVVARKAHLNAILMGRTGLSNLYLVAAPVLLTVGLRAPERLRRLDPRLASLLVAGAGGSLAAFLLNDSGIVAGGLVLVQVVLGACWLALAPRAREGERRAGDGG